MSVETRQINSSRKCDVIVLGAGIVGTSIALHLVRRGATVVLVDSQEPGNGTSFGNAGVIEGNTIFPPAFPSDIGTLLRIALKFSTKANYHFWFLPKVAPWLLAYRANTTPRKLEESARAMRPLFARAVSEHKDLMAESHALSYLRESGWLNIYRTHAAFEATAHECEMAATLGVKYIKMDQDNAFSLERCLQPVFEHAIFWPEAANVTNPLKVTQAYAARFLQLGGKIVQADAQELEQTGGFSWRITHASGDTEAHDVVVALGPWTPDFLKPFGIRLPMGIKRGYHHHFRQTASCNIGRPVLDAEVGYYMTPMEPGIRITTGVEFAARDAKPTPVQFDRLLPKARQLLPLGKPLENEAWMGSRPCFADSCPVIGPAPGQSGMWLAYGHAHWGLTLGPVTGRLIAELIAKATPFCDPAPYSAERFLK